MSYTLQLSNDRYEVLAYTDQLMGLSVIEVVGNMLPMFELTFVDNDFEKLKYLNEKNPLTIGFQVDDRMVSSQFLIKPVKPIFTADTFTVALGGYLNIFDYFKGLPKVPYVNGTSVEALQQVAGAYFNTVEISPELQTDDKMVWLHNGKNARSFIQDIWKHMYSPHSLPMIGIGLDGVFRVSDIATLLKQEPKIKFSDTDDGDEDIELYVSAEVSDNTTGNTSLYGYTTERKIILEDTLEVVTSTQKPEVVMNTSTQMNETEMPLRNLTPMYQSTNVHKHWYEAYHQNFVRWSSLNNNTLTLTVNKLLPLNLMDLIYVKFPQRGQIGKSSDGNFIISSKVIDFDNTGDVTVTYTGIREVAQSISTAEDLQESSQITPYKI